MAAVGADGLISHRSGLGWLRHGSTCAVGLAGCTSGSVVARMEAPERRTRCTVRCGHPPVQRGPSLRLRTLRSTVPTWGHLIFWSSVLHPLLDLVAAVRGCHRRRRRRRHPKRLPRSLPLSPQALEYDAAAAAAAHYRNCRWPALSPTTGPVGPQVPRYGGRLVVFRIPRWMRSSRPPAWQPPVAVQDPPFRASTTRRGCPSPPPHPLPPYPVW